MFASLSCGVSRGCCLRLAFLTCFAQGTESFCCEECLDVVVASGIRVSFLPWESPNGTTQERGQFPELYIRALC